jgi:localization factor PodJL
MADASMKFGVPWNVKGVGREARDSAREAARRSGMSLGEWLNETIIERAADEGIYPGEADHETLAAIAAINSRLAETIERLDRRLDRLQDAEAPRAKAAPAPSEAPLAPSWPPAPGWAPPAWGPSAFVPSALGPSAWGPPPGYMPPAWSPPTQAWPQPPASPPAPPPAWPPAPAQPPFAQTAAAQPPAPPPPAPASRANADQEAAALDRVVAEIAARQRALDELPDNPPPSETRRAPSSPAWLEGRPEPRPARASASESATAEGWNAAWNAPWTMPWTPPAPAVDLSGLEGQLRQITAQLEKLHRPDSRVEEAIAGLRADLTDIARKLAEAMPRQAIEALENEMRRIAEQLNRTSRAGADNATVVDLGRGLLEVRDALRALTPAESFIGFDQAVRELSRKIDAMSHAGYDPAALQQLETAMTALRGAVSRVASDETLGRLAAEVHDLAGKVDQVAAQATAAQKTLLTPQIEAQLRAFTERLQLVQQSHGDPLALAQIQDRIAELSAKMEASDARLGHLAAIERGLGEVMAHLESIKTQRAPAANAPAIDALRRDIAQTQDSLESVHGTIDRVVDRLAMIETGLREPRAPAVAAPATAAPKPKMPPASPAVAANPASAMPASSAKATSPAAPVAAPRPGAPQPRERQPIDPGLPPDYPLEPGSGGPRGRALPSAAERIAASEAALGAAKPADQASTTQINFIAAARRAAQAAMAQASSQPVRPTTPDPNAAKSLGKKVRSLLAGVSIVLIVIGGLRIAMNLLDSGTSSPAEVTHGTSPAGRPADDSAGAPPAVEKPAAKPAAPEPSAKVLVVPPAAEPASPPPPAASQLEKSDPAGDVTGSIPAGEYLSTVVAAPSVLPADKFPELLRKAAAKGDPNAIYEVATRYLEGRGVPVSLEEGAQWLDRAAKAGLAPAQFRLGSLYEKGLGVKKNKDTARGLYVAAAERGNAKAMHNLAVLYAEGLNGKPDYKTAAIWFRKAADYGVADSQYNLAVLYARGVGVEQNFSESYRWFALAAAQGDKEAARKRDEIATRLEADEVAAAKRAAEAFRPQAQPNEAVNVKAPAGGWDHADQPAKKRTRTSGLAQAGSL